MERERPPKSRSQEDELHAEIPKLGNRTHSSCGVDRRIVAEAF